MSDQQQHHITLTPGVTQAPRRDMSQQQLQRQHLQQQQQLLQQQQHAQQQQQQQHAKQHALPQQQQQHVQTQQHAQLQQHSQPQQHPQPQQHVQQQQHLQQHARVLTHVNPRMDLKTIQTIRPVLPTPILTNIVASPGGLPSSGHMTTTKLSSLSSVLEPVSHIQQVPQSTLTKPPGIIQISSSPASVSVSMPLAVHSIRASNTVFTSHLNRGVVSSGGGPVLTTTTHRPVNPQQVGGTTVQLACHLPSVIHQTIQQPQQRALITAVKRAQATQRLGATLIPASKTQMGDITRASIHPPTPTTNTIQITLQHQRDLTTRHPLSFTQQIGHKAPAKVIVSNSSGLAALHGISRATDIPGVSINKPVLSVNATNIATLRPAISQVPAMSHIPTIPIAKVTPHRQQIPGSVHIDRTRSDPTNLGHAVQATGILVPKQQQQQHQLLQQHQQQQRTITRPIVTSVAVNPPLTLAVDQKTDGQPQVRFQQVQQQPQQPQPTSEYYVPYTQYTQLVYHTPAMQAQATQFKTVATVSTQAQKPTIQANLPQSTLASMSAPTRYPTVVVSVDQPRTVHTQHAFHSVADSDSYRVTSSTHAATAPNPSSSPRPTILRKRTNDGLMKKQLNLTSTLESMYPRPDSTPLSTTSSPKTPAPPDSRDSSQSSTDTALSNDASPNASIADVKIKQEPADSIENGSGQQIVSSTTNIPEVSPRKKPRKQLLQANEELKDESSDEDVKPPPDTVTPHVLDVSVKQEIREDYTDNEGVRWTIEKKRPKIHLLNHYSCNWKTCNNHFTRHSDIKVKDERRPTVNELSNQRRVNQKTNGWKFYHIAAQMEELLEDEEEECSRMENLQKSLSLKNMPNVVTGDGDEDMKFLHEVSQGTIQRSRLVRDQVNEAKLSLIKILDHRTRIMEIINRHLSKRPIKKKER